MSASQKKPWQRFIKRDTLQGRGGGKVQRTFRGEAAYVGRLRRLEKIILHLTMHIPKIPDKVLASMLDDVLASADVKAPEPSLGGRTEVQRNEVPVPHQGSPARETEREG